MNWYILVLGAAFGIGETAYFGWNWTPHSDAEVICDGITTIIVALGLMKS